MLTFFILNSTFLIPAAPAAQYKPLPVDGDGKLATGSKFVSANGIITTANINSNGIITTANINSFRQDFRLFIDTQPSPSDNNSYISKSRSNTNAFFYKDASGSLLRTVNSSGNSMPTYTTYNYVPNIQYWTDCEIKVIDKWGNLVYFTSTIALNNSQVAQLHPQITDKTPKIYYWETAWSNSSGGCWGERKQLTNFYGSIGATVGSYYCVSGIWIYPALDSTEKRTVPVFSGANAYTNKQVVWGEYVRSVFDNPDNTVLCWRQTTTYGETFNYNKIWRPVRIEYYGDFKEIK